MSFSHLLARAPYYSPAKFQASKRPAPSEVERRAYAPAPLVNPFETLSAPQFDTFVEDVSSRILGALSYDRERDGGKRRRGYLDDEEYWFEMGGRPGEFLGQSESLNEPGELAAQEVDIEMRDGDPDEVQDTAAAIEEAEAAVDNTEDDEEVDGTRYATMPLGGSSLTSKQPKRAGPIYGEESDSTPARARPLS